MRGVNSPKRFRTSELTSPSSQNLIDEAGWAMKAIKTILVLVCVLTSTVLTGCSSCPLTCSRHNKCNICTHDVTHADYTEYQHP